MEEAIANKERLDLGGGGMESDINRVNAVAVAVDVSDDVVDRVQPGTTRVIYCQNPSVRDNREVQCCYPITEADPAEMVNARNVAVVHICAEAVAIIFCRSFWCLLAVLLAIPSSSAVACCCKLRRMYNLWSFFGGLVFFLHAVAATSEALMSKDGMFDPNAFLFGVQIILCLTSALVMHSGARVASLLRDPISPANMQIRGMDAPQEGGVFPPSEVTYVQATLSS